MFRLIGPAEAPRLWRDRPQYFYLPESAHSLKAFDPAPPDKAGAFRIAVVGDSYSFAPYMQFDDAFPRRLERMLNLNSEGRKVEVRNYGVPGYSTYHESKQVLNAMVDDKSDLVILQITLNDPEVKPLTPRGMQHMINPYRDLDFDNGSHPILSHWHMLRWVMKRIHATLAEQQYEKYYRDLYENKYGLDRFEGSLKRIADMSANGHVPVVAVVFPLFGYPLDENYPFHDIHQYIHGQLEKLGIKYLDLTSAYVGAPAERIVVLPGEDYHPNEIAHRIAAEEIYSWLLTEGVLPPEMAVRAIYNSRTEIDLKPENRLDPNAPPRRPAIN